jgi:ACDE family multidrug resistance protein
MLLNRPGGESRKIISDGGDSTRMVNYARLAILAGAFSGPLAGNAVLAVVPILEQDFNLTAAEVLLSISFYMFPFAIFSFFSGSLSDIYGRRKVVTFGFMVYAVGALLCAMSQDAGLFYLSRAVQGFGYAFVNPVLVAILAEVVSPGARGRNMGYLAAATTAGVASGPLIAGILGQWDWRYTFYLIAVLCVVCNAAILMTYKGQGFRASGASLRSIRPNVERTIRNHGVLMISAIGFLNFFCYIGALSYVSDILSRPPLELSGGMIGAMVALTGLAGIFAAPMGGLLVDRVGRSTTASIGLTLVLLAIVSLYYSESILSYGISLALLGMGSQILWASLFTLTVELVPDIKGTVSSVFNSARFLGYAVSPLLLGPLYVDEGYDAVLISVGGTILIALVLSFLLRLRERPVPPIPQAGR